MRVSRRYRLQVGEGLIGVIARHGEGSRKLRRLRLLPGSIA
jgi:hypothetical protein